MAITESYPAIGVFKSTTRRTFFLRSRKKGSLLLHLHLHSFHEGLAPLQLRMIIKKNVNLLPYSQSAEQCLTICCIAAVQKYKLLFYVKVPATILARAEVTCSRHQLFVQ